MWDMKRPYRFDLLFTQDSMLAFRTTCPADITKGSRRAAVLTKRAAVTSLSAHVISAPPACLEGELSVTRKRVVASQPSVASITSHGTIECRLGAFGSRISLLASNTLRDLFEQFSLFSFLFVRVFGAQRNIHGTEVTLTT